MEVVRCAWCGRPLRWWQTRYCRSCSDAYSAGEAPEGLAGERWDEEADDSPVPAGLLITAALVVLVWLGLVLDRLT